MATTAQFVGADGVWFTDDDFFGADLNVQPAFISADTNSQPGQRGIVDRMRPFLGPHPGGVVFGYVDGSTHFVNESIDRASYINRSRIGSGEVVTD